MIVEHMHLKTGSGLQVTDAKDTLESSSRTKYSLHAGLNNTLKKTNQQAVDLHGFIGLPSMPHTILHPFLDSLDLTV